jgi:anti-sigma factor RsiW
MSSHVTDNIDTRADSNADTNRYSELTIGDSEVVVYDRKNHQAWLQSTVAVSLDELQ